MDVSNIVLGIDPGSRKMGYGLLKCYRTQIQYLTSGCIHSKNGLLEPLFVGLKSIIQEYQPTESAIEAVFFHRNPKSTLVLGQARGVALLVLEIAKLSINHYAPREIKQAVTGYGGAQKLDMQHMIQQILKLSITPNSDSADALSVALCHIHHRQYYDQLSQR